jgi:uncharacterized Fe-S cluster protein YjdI
MSNRVTRTELAAFKKNKESVKEFSNGEMTVFWRPELCIHSANCLLGQPEVFNNRKKPWINMHAAGSKDIMQVVDTCPSRALTYLKSTTLRVNKPRLKKKQKPKFARIQLLKDGPALITGNFIIRDGSRKKIKSETEIVALCRCGGSHKKPFCDGTHQKIGFKG